MADDAYEAFEEVEIYEYDDFVVFELGGEYGSLPEWDDMEMPDDWLNELEPDSDAPDSVFDDVEPEEDSEDSGSVFDDE